MIIELEGKLTDEEKDLVFQLEDRYPDTLVVREIVAGFDGHTVMQILSTVGDLIAVGTVIIQLIELLGKKGKHTKNKLRVTVTNENGSSKCFSTEELPELERFIDSDMVNHESDNEIE